MLVAVGVSLLQVMENIEKMINCGDPSFGGAMYAYSRCGKMKFVPFRCKSRFCPACGVKYCQKRSTSMFFRLLRCNHRHCVFTIDEKLRHFFLEDRSLLDCLFQAVLLNEMGKRIGPSFKKTKALIYRKDKNGFYVYAKPSLSDSNTVIQYISRYLGRPVIDFIKLLIQHIPERNFKMTRYYGLYARHRVSDPSPGCRAVHPSKHGILRSFNR